MRPIAREDVLDLVAYEKARDSFRARLMELKQARRVSVGDRLTFIFENRDTVLFQIQEMLRADRMVEEDDVQAEIDVYNERLPRPGELSATLMIEIPETEQVRPELDRLIGIDEHVHLDVGDEIVHATFDPEQLEEDRISAVQYVRFTLRPGLAERFTDPSIPIILRVVHTNYVAETALDATQRASLAEDLSLDS